MSKSRSERGRRRNRDPARRGLFGQPASEAGNEKLVRLTPNVREAIGLTRVPRFTTLHTFAENPEIMALSAWALWLDPEEGELSDVTSLLLKTPLPPDLARCEHPSLQLGQQRGLAA